jgi:hypothetical protein
LDHILSQMKPVHTLTTYFFNIYRIPSHLQLEVTQNFVCTDKLARSAVHCTLDRQQAYQRKTIHIAQKEELHWLHLKTL